MERRKPARVVSVDTGAILQDPALLARLRKLARVSGRPFEKAAAHAADCLAELAVHPRERWLKRTVALARFIHSRSYEPAIDVDIEQLERLKTLAQSRLMLFLWSHKSHMDSFVFLMALYDNDFRPQPLSFAGINMNFAGFGALARRAGAIFLRRSFQDDPIYKLVLQHYLELLVRARAPLSWSIEGTRSRTGKLMPPKLGLLNWVLDACHSAGIEEVLLVPVAIAFDQIAEIGDYVAMQRGEPKRRESLRWFIDYVSGMREPCGRVYVRFAEPIAPTDRIEVADALLRSQTDAHRSQTQRIAFEVCHRIESVTPIKGADLVTLALLAANGRAVTTNELMAQLAPLLERIAARGLPTASGLQLERADQLEPVLAAMRRSGLIMRCKAANCPVFTIAPEKILAAAYYRNTVLHHFLTEAMTELALARLSFSDGEITVERLRVAALEMRDLFKFEFFFASKPVFLREVVADASRRFPGGSGLAGDSAPQAGVVGPPLFGHAVLRSFTEAYMVVARALLDRGDGSALDPPIPRQSVLALGEELLLRRRISSESALSQPLFENAWRLADYLKLLSGERHGLADRRLAFFERVATALAGVNLLQQRYDAAFFSPTAPA